MRPNIHCFVVPTKQRLKCFERGIIFPVTEINTPTVEYICNAFSWSIVIHEKNRQNSFGFLSLVNVAHHSTACPQLSS